MKRWSILCVDKDVKKVRVSCPLNVNSAATFEDSCPFLKILNTAYDPVIHF